MSALSSLLLWVYISPDYSAGVYEFKGASASLTSTGEGSGDGAAVTASFQSSSGSGSGSGSAYQGFGSDGI